MQDEDLDNESIDTSDIAVVGLACRLPGANTPQQYWDNLKNGIESVTTLDDEALRAEGVSDDLINNPNYVKRAAILDDMESFDAGFFNFSPLEATMMDPQHRHFLECSWEALESAGYDPSRFDGAIGLFAGSGHNAYMPNNLFTNPQFMNQHGMFLVRHTGNDKDFLTTRASYCFDLKGPSVNVQTACSTSLVAIHMAAQSLMSHESDIALAGGVTIEMPHRRGYMFQEGEILSPDGHCRSFDASSKGTVFGSGVGIVVLKRLEDALDDGDTIHALIKSSAVNNDGSGKVSYMAPSVDGQAAAIHEALTVAEIDPETIDYIECHGTGTPIGDPIEITALTTAFKQETKKKQFCKVGSVKSNIGHLDTAAGTAGFIKVVESLKNKQIPPSINFNEHNPAIDWQNSPFSVNDKLTEWEPQKGPRRAGVSALGVGGTNAHIILEEAPELDETSEAKSEQLFLLSAKTKSALEQKAQQLAAHLESKVQSGDKLSPEDLADIAYTLKVGRKALDHRQAFTANSAEEAISYLKDSGHERVARYQAPERQREVAFMMAGGGAQFPNMGLDLYEQEPVYRDAIDESLNLIGQFIDFDLRAAMFPDEGKEEWAAEELQKPSRSVTSIFITQYAQAKLWESWGVKPSALIGHSLGENTAACLAGVFSLKDALGLVALRGQLFEKVEAGGMLSVQLPEEELRAKLPSSLDVAAVNAPELSVVSGPIGDLESFQKQLEADDVDCQRVRINIAAHSRMLESILEEFRSYLKSITLKQPEIRIVSNYTGDWLCPIKASSADYWVDHLRNTVRFGEGVAKLLTDNQFILLEVGPGRTLSSLARMSDASSIEHHSLQSMRTHNDERDDLSFMLESFGRLWALNLQVDWKDYYGDEFRHRVPLPTYPFEHKKYWIEPGDSVAGSSDGNRHDDFHRWGYQPVWEPTTTSKAPITADESVLLVGSGEFADSLAEQLTQQQVSVTQVVKGGSYGQSGSKAELDFNNEDQWTQLLADLKAKQGALAKHIVFAESLISTSDYDTAIATGFAPLLMLSKALAAEETGENDRVNLVALTAKSLALHSDTGCNPLASLVSGPLSVLPSEAPLVVTKHVDIESSEASPRLASLIAKEIFTDRPAPSVVAVRGIRSYVKKIRPYEASQANDGTLVEANDTVLITGGLGGLGQEMCRALNALGKSLNLVLINRRSFADPSDWKQLAEQSGPGADKAKLLLSLQEAGHKVAVKSVDITDKDALSILKDELAASFGEVNAIVHTAGVIEDSLIAMKELDTVHRVLAPKVKGTLALMETFESDALKRVVLFSSSSSFNGLAGQVDYAAANAFLDAVAQAHYADGSDKVIAVNWPAWKESGMAARIATQQYDAIGGKPAVHPWMGSSNEEQPQETDYLRRFSVDSDWVLSEHRIKDAGCLLPGTSYIELARAAFCEKNGQQPVQINDVIFLSPCFVGDKEQVTVKTSLIEDNGVIEFVVSSYRSGDWVEHAKGKVAAGQAAASPVYDTASVKGRCSINKPVPANGNDQPALIFGKRWHCAQAIVKGDQEALINLKLADEFKADLEWANLHPALLDIATAGVQDIIPGYDPKQHFMIPLGYNTVNYFKPFTQQLVSHVSLAEPVSFETSADHHNDTVSFNVNITDEQGNLLAEIKEFNMKRVQPEFDSAASTEDASIDPLLETTLSFGITNEEGQQAFIWALDSLSLPQIIVSPYDANFVMATLKAAANDSGDAAGPAISVDRETLSEDFVEPSTDLEKQIAAIWRDTLGVDQVGVKDNFFELGGHSLLLTRVGTKLKKQLKKELPMSMMFKDPTIEKWSKALEGDGDAAPAKQKTSIKRASRDALRKKRS